MAESSDLSEWPRSTDAKEHRRRRQMSGTATGIVSRVDDLVRIVIPPADNIDTNRPILLGDT